MQIYLVGGAVRDELLGRPVRERDWVVVGASPEALEAEGFIQVGRDFPVFLHPQTKEEYALARTERKSGPGHKGFDVHAGPEVTLTQDLARRDLTINAIARAADGTLVDPYGGRADLDRRLLRHVSDAYSEDPLRVLRTARFAAQLPGFSVAPQTLSLMTDIATRGDLAELPAERVEQEVSKLVRGSQQVAPFFAVLDQVQGLVPWLAEFRGRRPAVAGSLEAEDLRYAALFWGLPVDATAALTERLKTSRRRRALALQVARHGELLAHWAAADAAALQKALVSLDAFRAADWHQGALAVVAAQSGIDLTPLRAAVEAVNRSVTSAVLQRQGLEGAALGAGLAAARTAALAAAAAAHQRAR